MSEKQSKVETIIVFFVKRISFKLLLRQPRWILIYPIGFFFKYPHCYFSRKLENGYFETHKFTTQGVKIKIETVEEVIRQMKYNDSFHFQLVNQPLKDVKCHLNCVKYLKKSLGIKAWHIITPFDLLKFLRKKYYGCSSAVISATASSK